MFALRQLTAELRIAFEKRGIDARVIFGNWSVDEHRGANSVIVGLGDFDPDAQNFPTVAGPGPVIDGSGAAATVSTHAQQGVVWIHAVAPEGTAEGDIPDVSHDATAELLHKTIAGLRGVCAGRAALIFEKGQWPKAGLGDISWGALAMFRFWLAIPVRALDAYAVAQRPYKMTGEVLANLSSGPVVAATVQGQSG